MIGRLNATVVIAAIGIVAQATLSLAGQSAPPSDPQLVYLNKSSAITVSNADGSSPTVLLSQVGLHRPSWSRQGGGTADNPYKILYEYNICQLARMDVILVAGIPKAQSIAKLPPMDPLTSQCSGEFSPGGDRIVFSESNTEVPPSSIWTMSSTPGAGGDFPVYDAPQDYTANSPTYSPDGGQIAFVEIHSVSPYTYMIKLVNSDGTNVRDLYAAATLQPRFLEWSPKGDVIAFSAADGYIYRIGVTPGSVPARIIPGGEPSFSADATRLVYGSMSNISSVNLTSRSTTVLVRSANHPKMRH